MTLKKLLEKQRVLMQAINTSYKNGVYKPFYLGMSRYEAEKLENNKTEETRVLVLAHEDELHEFLRELNWKPWKKQTKIIDLNKLEEELADAWHFLLELTLLWNFEDSIEKRLKKTFSKNHKRAKEGY